MCNPNSHIMVKVDCLEFKTIAFVNNCDNSEYVDISKRVTADLSWHREHNKPLLDFLEDLKLDQLGSVVGVRWNYLLANNLTQTLSNILEIEKIVTHNLKNFRISASDYMLGVFSNEVYNTSLKVGDKITCSSFNFKGFCEPNWFVYRMVDNAATGYGGAIFENKQDQLLVLAHRGTANIKQWITNVKILFQNHPENIVEWNEFGDVYNLTKSAYDYAFDNGYHLSMTGHSQGGLYSEIFAYLVHNSLYFKNDKSAKILTKTVAFDSPGAQEFISAMNLKMKGNTAFGEINNLGVKNYFLAPNIVNTFGTHTGTIFISKNYQSFITDAYFDYASKVTTAIYAHGIMAILNNLFDLSNGQVKYEEITRVSAWPKSDALLSSFDNSTALRIDGKLDLEDFKAEIKGAVSLFNMVENPKVDFYYSDEEFERWSVDPYIQKFIKIDDICSQLAYRILRFVCGQLVEGVDLKEYDGLDIISVNKDAEFESVDQVRETFLKLLTYSNNFKNVVNKSLFSFNEIMRIRNTLKKFNYLYFDQPTFSVSKIDNFLESLGEYYNNPDPNFNDDYFIKYGFVCGDRESGKTEFLTSLAAKLEKLKWPKFWIMDGDLELGALNLLDHIEVLSDTWLHNGDTLQNSLVNLLDSYKTNFNRILLVIEDFDKSDLEKYYQLLLKFISFNARVVFSSSDCELSKIIEAKFEKDKDKILKLISLEKIELVPLTLDEASSIIDKELLIEINDEQKAKLLDSLSNKSDQIIPVRLMKLIKLINSNAGYTVDEVIENYHNLAAESLLRYPEINMMLKKLEDQSNYEELQSFLSQLYLIANPIKGQSFDRGKFFSKQFLNLLKLKYVKKDAKYEYDLDKIYKQLKELSLIEDKEEAFTNGMTLHSAVMNEIRWFVIDKYESKIGYSQHNNIFQRILELFQEWDDFNLVSDTHLILSYAVIKDYIKALTEYALLKNEANFNVVDLAKVCRNLSAYTQYKALKDAAEHSSNSIKLLNLKKEYLDAEGGYVMATCLMQQARISYLSYEFEKAKSNYLDAYKIFSDLGKSVEAEYVEALIRQVEQKTSIVQNDFENGLASFFKGDKDGGEKFYKSVLQSLQNEGTGTIKKDVTTLITFVDSLTLMPESRSMKLKSILFRDLAQLTQKSILKALDIEVASIIEKMVVYAEYFESFAAPIAQQIYYSLARYKFYNVEFEQALKFAEKAYYNAEGQDSYSIDYLDLIVLMQRIHCELKNKDELIEYSKEALDLVNDVRKSEIGPKLKMYLASLLYDVYLSVYKDLTNRALFDDSIFDKKSSSGNGLEHFIEKHAIFCFEIFSTIMSIYEEIKRNSSEKMVELSDEYTVLDQLAKFKFLLYPFYSSNEKYSLDSVVEVFTNGSKLKHEKLIDTLFKLKEGLSFEQKFKDLNLLILKYHDALAMEFTVLTKPSEDAFSSNCAYADKILNYVLQHGISLEFSERLEQINELQVLLSCPQLVDRIDYKAKFYEVVADGCMNDGEPCRVVKQYLYYSALKVFGDDHTNIPFSLKKKFVSSSANLCNNLKHHFDKALCIKYSSNLIKELGIDLDDFYPKDDIVQFIGDEPNKQLFKASDAYEALIRKIDSCFPSDDEQVYAPDLCNSTLINHYRVDLVLHYI